MTEDQSAAKEGVIVGLLAYTMWGLFPIYFKQVGDVLATEVLAHRVIWAVPFGALIIFYRHQWTEVRVAFSNIRTLAWLALAAFAISTNWLIYIWAINGDRIFESSLGYYINPMMYVLVGVVFFGESLRRWQIAAVVSATTGVMILTLDRGQIPWTALSLAVLFTVYGVIRKQVKVGAMPGLFVETVVLLPIAFIWLLLMLDSGEATFLNSSNSKSGWLILAGPLTVLPLLLFAIATKRLTLTTIGFMQFVGPTLQFFTGIYYGEVLTRAHTICFTLIWIAVAFFIYDALRASKKPLPTTSTGA